MERDYVNLTVVDAGKTCVVCEGLFTANEAALLIWIWYLRLLRMPQSCLVGAQVTVAGIELFSNSFPADKAD